MYADIGHELRVQHHQQRAVSCTVIFLTFDFPFRRAELNRRPSDLVRNITPTIKERKSRKELEDVVLLYPTLNREFI